ncbi:hypothetical protein AB0K51_19875 [Kitasatospora sp. NPDC049285]|uniref:hypothetical protein n=1 Tax=Kitasatospora sp. NPDC049285 TaxID=3157096 RepID=UPI003449566C
MRAFRLAAAAACLAVLTACGPDDTPAPAASSPAAAPSSPAAAPASDPPSSAPPSAAVPSVSAGGGKASPLPAVWISPQAVPLESVYHWGTPAKSARGVDEPVFVFEQVCRGKRPADLPRPMKSATAALGGAQAGDWQADETVGSWGPATSSAQAQAAYEFLGGLIAELKDCASTAPGARVEVTTEDAANKLAATLTVPQPDGTAVQLHEYLTVSGGAVAELALRAQTAKGAKPRTAWSAPTDDAVLKALAQPVCTAFKDC